MDGGGIGKGGKRSDQYQWLTDYEVPQHEEGEEDGDFAYSFSKAIEVSSLKAGEEAKFTTPVYLPESDGTLHKARTQT